MPAWIIAKPSVMPRPRPVTPSPLRSRPGQRNVTQIDTGSKLWPAIEDNCTRARLDREGGYRHGDNAMKLTD